MTRDIHSRQSRHTLVNGVLLSAAMLSVLASTARAQYGGGSGTSTDPYQIYTAEELAAVGEHQEHWGKYFKLMDNVDLAGYDETNFKLIGYWHDLGHANNMPFYGVFDGNGKTISNFRYWDMDAAYVGLFQYVRVGKVSNLTLRRAEVVNDGWGAGSLVGYLEGGSVIACHTIAADVSGYRRVGGLIGHVDGGVEQCSSTGNVSGVQYAGGLIGQVGEGNVLRSYSRAHVLGVEYVGGFAGGISHEAAVINGCYATGSVQGSTYVGGLVGLVAQGRVYRSYSAGAVSADQSGGGLVGNTMFLGNVLSCYWDMEASGQTQSGGGTGKTTAQMQTASTYNWDFFTTWTICEGMNYPVFVWQIPQADLRCPDGVELIDFALFALKWRHRNCGRINDWCGFTDFDESRDVGPLDLAILAEDWLAGLE